MKKLSTIALALSVMIAGHSFADNPAQDNLVENTSQQNIIAHTVQDEKIENTESQKLQDSLLEDFVIVDEDTEESTKKSAGWVSTIFGYTKAVVLPVAKVASMVVSEDTGKQIGGHIFENIKRTELDGLKDNASTFGKLLIQAATPYELQVAYENGAFYGGIVGHFLGGVTFDAATYLLSGNLFSKNFAKDIVSQIADTGAKQFLIHGTSVFVTTSAQYAVRHCITDPAILAASTAVLGPLGAVVAVPVMGAVNNSHIVSASIDLAYTVGSKIALTTVKQTAKGVMAATPVVAHATKTVAQTAYGVTSSAVSKIGSGFSNWWYGKPAAQTAASPAA